MSDLNRPPLPCHESSLPDELMPRVPAGYLFHLGFHKKQNFTSLDLKPHFKVVKTTPSA